MLEEKESDQGQLLLSGVLFILTAFLFAPTTLWLVEQTIYFEQLKHAFLILGVAGIYLMMENRQKLRLVLKFNNLATALLLVSFLLLGLNVVLHLAIAVVVSYCLAIAGWVIFLFGSRLTRVVLALLSAFSGYVVLVLFQPFFDWPLRSMSGQYSAAFLSWLGHDVKLSISKEVYPKLLLWVNEHPFEVAAECNGFGLISGCILLGLLLVYFRRVQIFDKILMLLISALVGSVFNVARIITICQLAPVFLDHYILMHEVIGNLFFWGALAVVWWVNRGLHVKKSRRFNSGKSIIFFDGECFMCNRSMRFLMKIDRKQRLWFAPLQGETARKVIERRDDLDFNLNTIIFVENTGVENEVVSRRSTAVLKALEYVGGIWSVLGMFLLVPVFFRDGVYRLVAANRIKWFGKTEMCSLIPPKQRERLLP